MATCAEVVREKFPGIDEEMFSYVNGEMGNMLNLVVVSVVLIK